MNYLYKPLPPDATTGFRTVKGSAFHNLIIAGDAGMENDQERSLELLSLPHVQPMWHALLLNWILLQNYGGRGVQNPGGTWYTSHSLISGILSTLPCSTWIEVQYLQPVSSFIHNWSSYAHQMYYHSCAVHPGGPLLAFLNT